MGKRKRNVEPKSKKVRGNDDDEDTTSNSDSNSGSDKASDNKHRRKQIRARSKRNANNKKLTIQSGEDDDGSESDDEALVIIAKNGKKLDVEAIVSNKSFNGKMKYLLKWKDGSETWEAKKKTTKICPSFLLEYTEKAKEALAVEAIVSQRKKNSSIKYLIRWKDHSKGETWETEFRAKQLCPELVTLYVEEMEMTKRKDLEVEDIVGHEYKHQKHKYLIKWKDHSKGETWESTRKTISLCPDILNKFTKDRPEAAPPLSYFTDPTRQWYKETKDKPEKRKHLFGRTQLSDEEDESDDSPEWEVAHIVKHRNRKDKSCEFLIRWKGYTAKDDTWEAEENLNCPDVIEDYLARIEEDNRKKQRAVTKKTDCRSKELTVGKKNVDNRSSKLFDRKKRPVYFDSDDD